MKRGCSICGYENHESEHCLTVKCRHCNTFGHWTINCENPRPSRSRLHCCGTQNAHAQLVKNGPESAEATGENTEEVVIIRANVATANNEDVLLDTGATHCMTGNAVIFSEYPLSSSVKIILADGKTTRATGHGTIRLQSLINQQPMVLKISNVLFVPGFPCTLLSFAALRKSSYEFEWIPTEHSFKLLDNNSKTLVAVFREKNNLFPMLRDTYINPTAFNTRIIQQGTSLDWHRRLGHICHQDMIRLAKSGVDPDLNISLVKEKFDCEACHQGKMARQPFSDSTSPQTTSPLQLVHTDICGPMKTQSFGHARWFVIFLDDYSNYFQLYPLTRPGQMAESFKKFHQYVKTHLPQHPILTLRSDNGPEYHSAEFEAYLVEHGIKHEFTVRHTPQQNGKAERLMRTIQEGVKTVLIDAELPMVFWALAATYITHIRNRTIPSMKEHTPLELFFNEKPSLQTLRPFGCKVFIYQPKDTRGKLDPAAHPGIFVGYEQGVKGYKVYDTKRRRIYMSRDLLFYENEKLILPDDIIIPDDGYMPAVPWVEFSLTTDKRNNPNRQNDGEESQSQQTAEDNKQTQEDIPHEIQIINQRTNMSNVSPMQQLVLQELQQRLDHPNLGLRPTMTEEPNENNQNGMTIANNDAASLELRRSQRIRKPNREYDDFEVNAPPSIYTHPKTNNTEQVNAANIAVMITDGDPKKIINKKAAGESEQQLIGLKNSSHYLLTDEQINVPDKISLYDAKKMKQWPEWKKAMDLEYENLIFSDIGLLDLIPRQPGMKVVDSKWVLTSKHHNDGSIGFKARLCTRGFRQTHGIDYFETFAPTLKYTSLRIILAIVAAENLELHVIDIKAAFLNANLNETVYLAQPEEFIDESHRNYVIKLKKPLYGLKQAPREWYKMVREYFEKVEITASTADECVFIGWKAERRTIIGVFVDDMPIIAETKEEAKNIVDYLKETFKVHDLGEATVLLGMEIRRDRGNGTLALSQERYIEEKAREFKIEESNPVTTALPSGYNEEEYGKAKPLEEGNLYRQIVGSLVHATNGTRPDIAFAVSTLSRHLNKPTELHWKAAKHCLKYLYSTRNKSLVYQGNDNLIGAADANFAQQPGARSTTGYIFTLAGSAVSWKSTLQTTVALSTTEAELMGASDATREAIWLRHLLTTLGYDQSAPTPILEDNQAVIKLSKNPENHKRTKHISTRHFFIRQRTATGEIQLIGCKTQDMIADMLTKSLSGIRTQALSELFNLTPWTMSGSVKIPLTQTSGYDMGQE